MSLVQTLMANEADILSALARHSVEFVLIGGHAVIYHGYGRTTEDIDVVWLRSPEAEVKLHRALTDIEAHYIGNEIDPATRLERTFPVTLSYIRSNHLMMLYSPFGFLDLFDFVPNVPTLTPSDLFTHSVMFNGIRHASLPQLREMKRASGRPKDLIDLQNLPE